MMDYRDISTGKIISEKGSNKDIIANDSKRSVYNGTSNMQTALEYQSLADGLKQKKFFIDRNLDITTKEGIQVVNDLVSRHQRLIPYYDKLEDLYLGSTAILKKGAKEDGKSDQRLSVNYAKYIVDTETGFFNGHDTQFQYQGNDDLNDALNLWLRLNNSGSLFNRQSTLCSIFGHSYIFLYDDALSKVVYKKDIDELNEDDATMFDKAKSVLGIGKKKEQLKDKVKNIPLNTIRMAELKPQQCFIIYANDTTQEPLYAFMYKYVDDDGLNVKGDIYRIDDEYGYLFEKSITKERDETVTIFKDDGHQERAVINKFSGLPLIEMKQNEDRVGKVELVITIQNAYNTALSNLANEVGYLADSILHIDGVQLSPNQKSDMKDENLLNTWQKGQNGIQNSQITAGFIEKQATGETSEKLLNRLKDDMFSVANIVNFNDVKVGSNVSGETLKVMMKDMQSNALTKQRQFSKGFDAIFKVLFEKWGLPLHYLNINYTYTLDMPVNKKELAEMIAQLKGNLSTVSILGNATELYSGSPDDELYRMEQEGIVATEDEKVTLEDILSQKDENNRNAIQEDEEDEDVKDK